MEDDNMTTKHLVAAMAACAAMGFSITHSSDRTEAEPFVLSITLGAEAQAQFSGKIKRIRIKKKRVGSGFKIVPVGTGSSAKALDSVRSTLRIEPREERLEVIVLDIDVTNHRNSQRRISVDTNTPALAGDTIEFTLYAALGDDDEV
jgi:hypothetical protein